MDFSSSKFLHRSQINRLIEESIAILDAAGFLLPPFSTWSPDQWRSAGPEWNGAREARLGWDVTDFGLGNFRKVGRVLFTLRNGGAYGRDKPYAEKIIIGRHGQHAPSHYHGQKIEDIINRGGGDVVLHLNPPIDGRPAMVYRDGLELPVTPDLHIRLGPGESLCIPPGVIHRFWGEVTAKNQIPLIGEVSSFCDDVNDNFFLQQVLRFSLVVEDEPARFALCHELPSALESDLAIAGNHVN